MDGLLQEDAVEYLPRMRGQPERDVADAQDRMYTRQSAFYSGERLQSGRSGPAQAFVAAAEGEGERVEDQILGVQPVLLRGEPVDPFGYREFFFTAAGHSLFIYSQANQGCSVPFGQRKHRSGRLFAVLEIDGVDQGPAAEQLEGRLDDMRRGGVDDQGKVHIGAEAADQFVHVTLFIPSGVGYTDIQGVGSGFLLGFSHGNHAVPVILQEMGPELLAAVGIGPFTNEKGRRLLVQLLAAVQRGQSRLGPAGAVLILLLD